MKHLRHHSSWALLNLNFPPVIKTLFQLHTTPQKIKTFVTSGARRGSWTLLYKCPAIVLRTDGKQTVRLGRQFWPPF